MFRNHYAAVLALLNVVLIAACFHFYRAQISTAPGIDYYHPWLAIRGLEAGLDNPYHSPQEHSELAKELQDELGGESLKRILAAWKSPQFTGTPLYYSAYSFAPRNYLRGLKLQRTINIVLLLAAIATILLSLNRKHLVLESIALSSVAFLSYFPVANDIILGNVTCVQLFLLSAILFLLKSKRRFAPNLAIALATFAFFFKPSIAILLLFVLPSLVRTAGQIFSAMLTALLCIAVPVYVFSNFRIWQIWFEYNFTGKRRVFYDWNYRTHSIPAFLNAHFGISIEIWSLGLFVVGVCALYWILKAFKIEMRSILATESLLISSFFLFFFSSPLIWYQYYALLLLPMLVVLLSRSCTGKSPLYKSSLLFVFLFSGGFLSEVFELAGVEQARRVSVAFTVFPLFLTTLFFLLERREPAH